LDSPEEEEEEEEDAMEAMVYLAVLLGVQRSEEDPNSTVLYCTVKDPPAIPAPNIPNQDQVALSVLVTL
jgi:hypothetical protein